MSDNFLTIAQLLSSSANSTPFRSLIKTFFIFHLLSNIDLDETKGTLTTHAWLKMQWTDTKLKWDNSSYGGISVIRVSADEVRLTAQITRSINQNLIALLPLPPTRSGSPIWQFTTALSRTSSTTSPKQISSFTMGARFCGWVYQLEKISFYIKSTAHESRSNLLIWHMNEMMWKSSQVPTAKFETYCPMNLKFWPYDTQHCNIKVNKTALITSLIGLIMQSLMSLHFRLDRGRTRDMRSIYSTMSSALM